jgi:solute:Na+ symporter, SSS family
MIGQLSIVDFVVVLLYLVVTTLMGLWFTGKQRDTKSYFVGDRNVHWLLVLVSIVATETSTVTFLSIPGLAYTEGGNFTFLQLAMGYILGRLVVAWILLPQFFRGEAFTAYQLLRERFDQRVQRVASGLFLVTRSIADGLRLFLTALLLKQFTGWDMSVSILVMAVITIVYTFLGGMQAVIWTDLIQFVIYVLGAVFAGLVILQLLPGGWATYLDFAEQNNKFTLFDFNWNPAKATTFWAGLIGGAFVSMASHGVDQLMVQRYLCSTSVGKARLALVSSGFVVFSQFVLFLMIGVGLHALKNSGVLAVPPGTRNDEVFGIFMIEHLPRGILGFVIAAVLAAAMSTLSSSLNSSATALVTDFYRPLRPNHSEGHYLTVSKVSTILWGVVQMGVAFATLAIGSLQSIIDQVLAVAGFTTGIILGLFILGSLPRPVSPLAALLGMLCGFGVVLTFWLGETFGVEALKLAWPWYAPLGSLTTAGTALLLDRIGIGHGPSSDRGAQPPLDAS